MTQSPSALLFIAGGCPHCPTVLQAMGDLIKAGKLSRLEVINIQQDQQAAEKYKVRSVPWVKIGPFELVGLRTQTELQQWIDRVDDPQAMGEYFAELMTSGEINKIQQLIEKNPQSFESLIQLMADPETSMSVRIGIGAIMEEFAASKLLKQNIDLLGRYTQHEDARVRNDACYYLGLSQDKAAEKYINPLLDDNDAEVREVAEEAMEVISRK